MVLLVGHLSFKGSKTSHFIMKSYFKKSFEDILGKVLKKKKKASNFRKKWGCFLVLSISTFGDFGLENWQLSLKSLPANIEKVNQTSVCQRIPKFWFICHFYSSSKMFRGLQIQWLYYCAEREAAHCAQLVSLCQLLYSIDKSLQLQMISSRFYNSKNRHLEL